MQKYLLDVRIDVADEDYAVLLTVINEDTYNKLKKSMVSAVMFQTEEEEVPFETLEHSFGNEIRVTKLSPAEAEVLEKLDIYASAGAIFFTDEDGEEIDII